MKSMMKLWRAAVVGLGAFAAAATAQDVVTYYHNDHVGSPIAATAGTGHTQAIGEVLWTQRYQPYGTRTAPLATSTGNTLWFTGKRVDERTGLVYMGARYYDPALGRFISPDPVGFVDSNAHSFNRYAYANNNPYAYHDPEGEAAETVFDLVSFGLSVAIFRNEPTIGNFLGAVVDGAAVAIPFVPGGVGALRTALGHGGAAAAKGLPDSALVCRGGACKADNFSNGSDVSRAADGTLNGVSTQSRPGATVDELAKPFKNNQVGVTTAGDIRKAGGRVTADGHGKNPNHATVDGLTPQQLEQLFSPTIQNPVAPSRRGL